MKTFLLASALLSASAFAVTVDLPSVADGRTISNVPDTNYGAETRAYAYRSGANYQVSLVRFDLSGIPAKSIVQSATLELTNTGEADQPEAAYDVYRVGQSWDESQFTFNSSATGVDWPSNTFNGYTGKQPDLRGTSGAFGSAPFATLTFPVVDGALALRSFDVTALVRKWVNGEFANDGFGVATSAAAAQFDFATKEWAVEAQRPVLSITYEPFVAVTVKPAKSKITLTAKKTANVTVKGAASGSVKSVEYRLGGGAFKPARGAAAWSVALKKLKPGRYKLQVRAADLAGGTTAPATVSIVVKKKK